LPLEQKFPAVAKAVSKLKLRSTVVEGEIVAVDENGIPRFQLLQRFQKQPTAPTLYYVFDVLWRDSVDITGQTILERRALLERIIKPVPGIQLGTYVEHERKALFQLVKEKGIGRRYSLLYLEHLQPPQRPVQAQRIPQGHPCSPLGVNLTEYGANHIGS
jgi:hypothetical protein